MPRCVYEGDTIAAIATPAGEGGIGILRLSGPAALAVADRMFLARNGKSAASQKNFSARYGRVGGEDGASLDEALLLVMRAPQSYTGEDVAEIQMHGGPAALQAALGLALRSGARLAEPGEFTKRAYLNGRLDLLQAEAVLDLIQAKTERSVRWAASQLGGHLSEKMRSLKETLLGALTHLEAAVDFPEDHPETDTLQRIDRRLSGVQEALERLLKEASLGFLAKRGLKAALWGRPNVGKSSLLNRLTRLERVIVTPHPGTTRDVVEEEALVGGFPVRFQDTAGVQSAGNPVEKEAIERSRKAAVGADLVLFVLDASQPLQKEDEELWEELSGKPVIVVLNKADLPRRLDSASLERSIGKTPAVLCSCVQEHGTDALEKEVLSFITKGQAGISDEPLVSTARQKECLEKTLEAVRRAREACSQKLSYEFVAADLRHALDHLAALVGEVATDEVLELLFSKFCIGK